MDLRGESKEWWVREGGSLLAVAVVGHTIYHTTPTGGAVPGHWSISSRHHVVVSSAESPWFVAHVSVHQQRIIIIIIIISFCFTTSKDFFGFRLVAPSLVNQRHERKRSASR